MLRLLALGFRRAGEFSTGLGRAIIRAAGKKRSRAIQEVSFEIGEGRSDAIIREKMGEHEDDQGKG